MEKKDKHTQENSAEDKRVPIEHLSGDDLLSAIEKDDSENSGEDQHSEESGESNELLKKFGFSKKDKLKKENTELKQKAEELNDKFVRLYAEFDNFKKRSMKERIEFAKMAGSDVIISMLPVLDDFSRAQKQIQNSQDTEALKEGVNLIQQKLTSILEAKGLKKMKSIGEVFNPEFHDAITEIPVQDANMKGKVVDEVESGYFLNDKIIRHAKVIVGK